MNPFFTHSKCSKKSDKYDKSKCSKNEQNHFSESYSDSDTDSKSSKSTEYKIDYNEMNKKPKDENIYQSFD